MSDFNPAALDRCIEGEDRDDEPRDLCPECGTDRADDEHAVNCSHHPQFNEPDARDEHDSPCDYDGEEM